MKYSIGTLAILLLLVPIHALQVSLSPAHISLIGKKGQMLCENITLIADKKVTLYGEDRWSFQKGASVAEYNLSAAQIGIKSVYPKPLTSDAKESTPVCFTAEKAGTYYGILLYKNARNSAAIGSRIRLTIIQQQSSKNEMLVAMGSTALLTTLFVVILIYRKKRKMVEEKA